MLASASKRTWHGRRREVLARLGANVQASRRARGLSQMQVASLLDVSVAYVSLIERGRRNPPFTTFVAIAHALGIHATRTHREGAVMRRSRGRCARLWTAALRRSVVPSTKVRVVSAS